MTKLTGTAKNPTIYQFGYLRPAHTLCYWTRRDLQVRGLIDEGAAPGQFSLPTCQN